MWAKIQRNYLPILSGAIFLVILVLVVVQIDKQIYQAKKKKICTDNWERICPRSLVQKLDIHATQYFNAIDQMRNLAGSQSTLASTAKTALAEMDKETSRILSGPNSLISISVSEVQYRENEKVPEQVVFHELDKYSKYNTTTNSLVLRRFWGETAIPYPSHYPPYERVGEITFRYTTPMNLPEIGRLTARFRWILAGVILSLGLLYWYILRQLIMPINLITARIDRSKGDLPDILPAPHSVLEAAYNDLARDALLNAVTRTMAEYMSVDRLVSAEEIVQNMPDVIAPHFAFGAVYAVHMIIGETDKEPITWEKEALHPQQEPEKLVRPAEADWLELGRRLDLDWDQGIMDFSPVAGGGRHPHYAVAVASDREDRWAMFLAATPRVMAGHETLQWHRETLLLVANAIQTGLETIDIQRKLIQREQSKANISLSRNLGHDLTNVVATSKLELDTVRRFLKLPDEKQIEFATKMRDLFTESLSGLLNNTKFLQEIINIYRSFSYMHHPEYEWVNFNDLVDEVVELFQLSLSRRFTIHKDYAENIEDSYIEPRLMKLAVFNLLSNAADALKRRAMGEGDFGAQLWVSTSHQPGEFGLSLAVRDNGLGIRNQQGELAMPEEIRDIFTAGFTTKQEGMVEGLGLNWVRQIIHDFHGGNLHARNHPEGGAEVSLLVPRYETPPNLGDEPDNTQPEKDGQPPQSAEGNK